MSFLSSSTNLFMANAALTIPFGIGGLANPAFTFGQFGWTAIEPTGLGVIRGYAAAALGYGIAHAQLARIAEAEYGLLLASAAFNLAEFVLQGHCMVTKAGFNDMIWTTFLSHGALGVWSVWILLQKGSANKGETKKSA